MGGTLAKKKIQILAEKSFIFIDDHFTNKLPNTIHYLCISRFFEKEPNIFSFKTGLETFMISSVSVPIRFKKNRKKKFVVNQIIIFDLSIT